MKSNSLNKLCYSTLNIDNPSSLEAYLSVGGYKAWNKIIEENIKPDEVINTVKNSGLRGRGGAGFSTGTKWGFINKNASQKYLVCNADESEPGTCKDRDILRYNPHAVIEGMLIACYAIGADKGYCYLRGEFIDEPYQTFKNALNEATRKGYVGKNIFNSQISIDIYDFIGAGAYICGEETAMLESLEGKNVFGPELLYNFSGKPISHHVKKKSILTDILYTVLLGAKYGKNRLGTMTKEGICFGLDPEYFSNDIVFCDWLPGGCILGKKENFIDYNFYPYEGKAYCEDILNSILRNKNNIKHYYVKKGKAFTLYEDTNIDLSRYEAEIRIRKYINEINHGSHLKFFIWKSFFYYKSMKNLYLNR